jgi:acetyl esterase/lipase
MLRWFEAKPRETSIVSSCPETGVSFHRDCLRDVAAVSSASIQWSVRYGSVRVPVSQSESTAPILLATESPMRRTMPALILCLPLVLTSSLSAAQKPAPTRERILLWAKGAPGAKGTAERDKPSITVYTPPAAKRNGCAVVVCPGGGYGHLAVGHEGKAIGEWFNTFGVTAFVLRYRIAPHYHHPAPITDAQRALRYVRHNAKKWRVDPKRIGIMGFSAGGHLVTTAATHFDSGKSDAADPIDRESCRPDFLIACYPVVTMTDKYTHRGSKRNLLGNSPDPKLVKSLSNETQVTKDTPPTFLFHTSTDRVVPAENSVLFYLACRKAGVPVEMHIYERGRHGVGLAPNDPILKTWPGRLKDWMKLHGFLKSGT